MAIPSLDLVAATQDAAAEMRDALDLKQGATRDVGTSSGTVASGDDARFDLAESALQPGDSSSQIEAENILKLREFFGMPTLDILSTLFLFHPEGETGASDVASVRIDRNADYTGGTFGFLNSALRINNNVTADTAAFESCLALVQNNYADAGETWETIPQHHPFATYGIKHGTAPTWGAVIIAADLTGNGNPEHGQTGIELDIDGNGGDDNFQRSGISFVARRPGDVNGNYTGDPITVGAGIVFARDPVDSADTKYQRGISFGRPFAATKFGTVFDLTNAVVQEKILDHYGVKISAVGNIALGDYTPSDPSGYATLNIGRAGNGGLIQVGDGTNEGRIEASSSTGMKVGTDTAIPLGVYTSGSERWRFYTDGHFRPSIDNAYDIGSASLRVQNGYAAGAWIISSDAILKTNTRELTEAERKVAARCRTLIRAFQMQAAFEEKGESARWHIGVIAQDVEAAFAAEGLDAWRYGIMCRDPVKATRLVTETVEVQATEKKALQLKKETRLEDRLVVETVEAVEEQPLFEELPVFDGDGEPIMRPTYTPRVIPYSYRDKKTGKIVTIERLVSLPDGGSEQATRRVPVMVKKTVERLEEYDTGETRLGIRYTELLCFIVAAI